MSVFFKFTAQRKSHPTTRIIKLSLEMPQYCLQKSCQMDVHGCPGVFKNVTLRVLGVGIAVDPYEWGLSLFCQPSQALFPKSTKEVTGVVFLPSALSTNVYKACRDQSRILHAFHVHVVVEALSDYRQARETTHGNTNAASTSAFPNYRQDPISTHKNTNTTFSLVKLSLGSEQYPWKY